MREKRIIQALRDRRDGAAEQFLTYYSPLLRYVISPILPKKEDTEECISEVAMRVWNSIDRYDPQKGSFNGWLTAIARNAALNRKRDAVTADQLRDSIPDSKPSPEEALIQKEQRQALATALKQLSPSERSLFFRKYYYLQPMSQIAAELGTTERAVEGRLYRIKKRLQKLLGGDRTDE